MLLPHPSFRLQAASSSLFSPSSGFLIPLLSLVWFPHPSSLPRLFSSSLFSPSSGFLIPLLSLVWFPHPSSLPRLVSSSLFSPSSGFLVPRHSLCGFLLSLSPFMAASASPFYTLMLLPHPSSLYYSVMVLHHLSFLLHAVSSSIYSFLTLLPHPSCHSSIPLFSIMRLSHPSFPPSCGFLIPLLASSSLFWLPHPSSLTLWLPHHSFLLNAASSSLSIMEHRDKYIAI
jgi:hypothetical protein